MAKEDEIKYFANLTLKGQEHAVNKPFSDKLCGGYLMDMGQIFSLLPPLDAERPRKLLDIGCGTGWTSNFFALRGFEVTGVDISTDMIAKAKEVYSLPNLEFYVHDYEDIPFREEFDCAVFYDSLHHAEDEAKAIKSAYGALAPEGVLVIVEPGTGHHQSKESVEAVDKYGVTEKEMPPWKTGPLCIKAGFRRIRTVPRSFILIEAFSSEKNILRNIFKILRHLSFKKHSGVLVAYK